MPVHRQTNRRRVSDAVVCAVLRDRVSNHLPIDAKSFRDLNFACGSDRFSRLRREVLRELEDDFATSREKPSAHTGDAAAPVAVVSGVWRSQDRAISEPADLQRAGDTRAVRSVRPTFRSGVAMICGAMLRRLAAMVGRLAISMRRAHGAMTLAGTLLGRPSTEQEN
jgi:hypothetical protein